MTRDTFFIRVTALDMPSIWIRYCFLMLWLLIAVISPGTVHATEPDACAFFTGIVSGLLIDEAPCAFILCGILLFATGCKHTVGATRKKRIIAGCIMLFMGVSAAGFRLLGWHPLDFTFGRDAFDVAVYYGLPLSPFIILYIILRRHKCRARAS